METSYGFRPKRSAHDALRKCKEYANEGYTYVVDMDLEKFFDTVNQSKMIEILSRTVKDGRVISLIHKYLLAGAMNRGRFEETKLGLVQSPLAEPLEWWCERSAAQLMGSFLLDYASVVFSPGAAVKI